MPALGAYASVWNSALAVLEEKGYEVWHDPGPDLFYAQKDGWDFAADDPTALLGLVAIYEHRKPEAYAEYWWRATPRCGSTDLPTTPPDYTPVWQRRTQ
jgi:hypothetical protein